MSRSDQELIRETLAGRSEAYGELVVRYQDRLFHSLKRVVRTPDDALEVSQDAFLQGYQKLGSFRGDSAFYSWLFRIAMNTALSRLRKKSQQDVSLTAMQQDQGVDVTDERIPEPSASMSTREQGVLVMEALDSLPEDFRIALALKELEGLKYDEIAEIVGVPIGTVRSRIHRARIELKARLKSILPDAGDK